MRLVQKSRTLWAVAALALLVGGLLLGRGILAQPEQPGAEAGQEVIDLLQTETEVPVVIALRSPPSLEAVPLEALPPKKARLIDVPTLQAEVASIGDSVLADLGPSDFTLHRQFEAVPALVGMVTESGLQKLLADPNVLRIDAPAGGAGHLGQSVPLINADDMHTDGYTGAGVVLAVLDTGLDTDHADLGGDLLAPEECFNIGADGVGTGSGGCPDGSERQSGAGAAEDDHGHGSNVTGVVTSTGTVSSIGVAPDADIAAYKVLDSGGFFYSFTLDIVGPLNDIILNRPEVDVINMSLGTDALFSGNCDNATAWTMAGAAAINTLRANGVISFASSGNNASSTQMSAPACLSNVVSVGATYDANIGSYTFPGVCTDPTTAVDQVACFTNSNTTTDIMAPGCRTTSTGLANGTSNYCGTSQASPHGAGCAALFLDANPGLTPGQIESRLETSSISVQDVTNGGLWFPRIDCYPAELAAPLNIYSAKFVCGTAAADDPLVPGDYATAINVHNPSEMEPATLYKKAALALPEDETAIAPEPPTQLELDPDYAFEIDCADIDTLLASPGLTFYNGFVVVESYHELDVVAVYTSTSAADASLSLDVEIVPAQVVDTGTLRIEKYDEGGFLEGGATFDISPDPATGLDGPITVTDGGAGDPDSTADGIIQLTAVPATYTVTETVAPPGCTILPPNPQTPAVSAGGTTVVAFTDDCAVTPEADLEKLELFVKPFYCADSDMDGLEDYGDGDGTHPGMGNCCDGVDNDGDGLTDGLDSDCWPYHNEDPVDGVDNDRDGLLDEDPAVYPSGQTCPWNGDDDCDTFTFYDEDPKDGEATPEDDFYVDEDPANGFLGIDNDHDGYVDEDGAGSFDFDGDTEIDPCVGSPPERLCGVQLEGVDDDGDTLVDEDPLDSSIEIIETYRGHEPHYLVKELLINWGPDDVLATDKKEIDAPAWEADAWEDGYNTCNDGLDNETPGDGLIDGNDPQCQDPHIGEEESGLHSCNDGKDNGSFYEPAPDGDIDEGDSDCVTLTEASVECKYEGDFITVKAGVDWYVKPRSDNPILDGHPQCGMYYDPANTNKCVPCKIWQGTGPINEYCLDLVDRSGECIAVDSKPGVEKELDLHQDVELLYEAEPTLQEHQFDLDCEDETGLRKFIIHNAIETPPGVTDPIPGNNELEMELLVKCVTGCASTVDSDLDGFNDNIECYLGTDAADACPDNPADDAWPLDNDIDRAVTFTGDVYSYIGKIGATPGNPNWLQRLDLDMDSAITFTGDVYLFIGNIGLTCP